MADGKWLTAAKARKAVIDGTISTAEAARDAARASLAQVTGELELLRTRVTGMQVWALITSGTSISAGTVVWYLGKLYEATDDHEKSLLDTPPGSEHWAEVTDNG